MKLLVNPTNRSSLIRLSADPKGKNMNPKRMQSAWETSWAGNQDVVVDASEDVTEEAIRAIEDDVRSVVDEGEWQVVEGPGW